ncbi:hypothetical protein [Brevundimonas sp.]|uniref:TipJ family phage tail tip protein n=1 Tax=Brevundimonas sp. TaxID=1871086 RepID=UPI0028A2179F|nr:hypothetical protein [Brevundimonas sp.]
MADGSLPIVVTPEAFGRNAFDLSVVEGLTVRGMLVEAVKAGLPVSVLDRTEIYIDGERLPRETALSHQLRRDQVVNVVVEPLGGGGGGGKDIGQVLLSVAVIAVSAWIGGLALTASSPGMLFAKLVGRAALQGAVLLGGQALISALFSPESSKAKANDRYALQSASNQYRQWGAMPLALGEVVTGPDLAAKTFTQNKGEDVWIYGILGLHYGPCQVSDVKIGDTLVSTMGSGDFQMVQHLTPGPRTFSLYPNDVDQLDLQEELQATTSSATPMVRAASSDGERFDIDFFLPGGLHFQKDDGRVLSASVSVGVRYRPIDADGGATGPWITGPTMSRTSTTKDPWRITHSVSVPLGRYEFELTRSRKPDDNTKRRDDIYVTAIKAVAFRKPINDETLSVIEFAVRASAINQGTLAPITCRIIPICETWTGSGWGAPVATSNPAALARWLLTGPAAAKPMQSSQADMRLRAWAALCDQYGWTSHLYLTEGRTQADVLQLLGGLGRASLFWDGTQVAASPWVEKPAPRQLFTGANLRDHSWSIVYPEPVHALRVEFQNIDQGGEPDELYVYADGYGPTADPANGIEAATLVEALRLEGQATLARAYKDGRWKLGQRLHQRRIDTWTADIENLASQLGDRVRLAWRRIDGGEARVRCRRHSGALISGLRLTQPVEMVAGVDYAVDLRTTAGLFTAVPIQTVPGLSREIIFQAPRSAAITPGAGDLIAFGVSERVSEDVEIIGIEPGENLTAVITGVRYVAPLLMAGETGPIPPLQTRLTLERSANPPMPTLLGVQQDANAVRVSFALPTWRGSPITGFSARWRAKPGPGETSGWVNLPALDATARELIAPPLREAPVDQEGVEATRAEIEIVAVTMDGRASRPLLVTVAERVVAPPLASEWFVSSRQFGEGETATPGLLVTGRVGPEEVKRLLIEYVKAEVSEADPPVVSLPEEPEWSADYDGDPTLRRREINGLDADTWYYVAVSYFSASGMKSYRTVLEPVSTGSFIVDIAPDAPALTPLKEQIERNAKRLLLEISQSWNRSKDEREYSISREELMTQNVLRTVEVLEIADADNLVRIETERLTRITEMANETLIRQQQVSGLGDNLAIIDTRSLTTASNLATFTETASVQISSLGSALSVVDVRSQTSATELVSLTSTTAGLLSSYNGLNSTVLIHSTAISGLELQNNLARLDLEVAAGGGQPARFSLISGPTATAAALMADSLWIGENFFFDTASRTMQTLAPGGMRRVIGAGFGVGGELDEWRGPANIAVSAMTVGNSAWAVKASDGKTYYGGSELGSGGGGLGATASQDIVTGTAPGGGYASTNTITINVTGPGASSAVVRWVKTDEVGGLVEVFPTGRNASFGGDVAPGGLTRAIFLAVVSSGGQSVTVVVDVQLTDPT